ncbi:hypothetical protein QFZ79_003989 [Arthrobacter sp. V4I6]|nr:hypothetical protein [Arthrobacter sp. V1I7]MDQ0855878.1 hypothetical protein [Arthrobacter sp. V4I6]
MGVTARSVDGTGSGRGKIAGNPQLREFVREQVRWTPRQISNRLRTDFPGQPEMRVVPETVYQALYGRGRLDLAVALHSGRTGHRPRRRKEHRTRRFPDTVMIRERLAEVLGRLAPGPWESQCCCQAALSADSWHWFLVNNVLVEHGPEDVDTASGEDGEVTSPRVTCAPLRCDVERPGGGWRRTPSHGFQMRVLHTSDEDSPASPMGRTEPE